MSFDVPWFVRGELVTRDWVPFGGRSEGGGFRAPDARLHVGRLSLGDPSRLADLQRVPLDEILDLLDELGNKLAFDSNPYVQEAYEAGLRTGVYPISMLRSSFAALPLAFRRESVLEMVEQRIGRAFLEGWVPRTLSDGRRVSVRAFGARSVHVPAGNGALISAVTLIRSAVTRSDAIVKAPSNDPLSALAMARTLADIAPDHPLTRHLCVAYWKGGDTHVEEALYRPEHVEKIVAWGGFASVKHVTRYIQPGLELISLDPKRSATVIGPEAFESDATLDEVARRAACDVGVANQEGCACARVIFALCGSDAEGIAKANRLGERIYRELQALPETLSTPALRFDRELRDHLDATRLDDTFYRVIGGERGEGAVVVSQLASPVDYSALLSGRVANLVPVDTLAQVVGAVNALTQTVGVYPESLKRELRDVLPLHGAQRLVSLGYACHVSTATPQDAIEPLRRMCKWIVDEECDPERVAPLWRAPDA